MNRPNIQLLRDTLAKHYLAGEGIKHNGYYVGFNMAHWYGFGRNGDHIDNCGTVACLGGWSDILRESSSESAANWLDLSSDDLFYPMQTSGPVYSSITVPEALIVLDNLLATGAVNWSLIQKRREHLRQGGYVPASPVYGRPETVSS